MGLFDVFKRSSETDGQKDPLMDSLKSAGFDVENISIQHNEGVAVLKGEVENGSGLDNMVNFLRRTPGVQKVVNEIKVKDVSSENIRFRVETKVSYLNLRKGPSTDFQIKGKIANGAEVVLIKRTNENWMKVQTDELQGYCNSTYLKPI